MNSLTRLEEVLMVAVWRLKDEAYGVRIRREVMRVLGEDVAYGTLYTALDQLVRKSLLEKALGETGEKRRGRPRVYYALAPEGVSALEKSRQNARHLWKTVPDLAFKQEKA